MKKQSDIAHMASQTARSISKMRVCPKSNRHKPQGPNARLLHKPHEVLKGGRGWAHKKANQRATDAAEFVQFHGPPGASDQTPLARRSRTHVAFKSNAGESIYIYISLGLLRNPRAHTQQTQSTVGSTIVEVWESKCALPQMGSPL